MPEIISISELKSRDFDGTIIKSDKSIYSIKWVRIRDDVSLDKFLQGDVFKQLNQHAVLEYGDIVPPDGTPLEDFELGSPAIDSLEEALAVAKAARTNPHSVLHAKGFPQDAPIYFYEKGKEAKKYA